VLRLNLTGFSTALDCSIAEEVYAKTALLQKDKQAKVKLQRVGEAVFEGGRWFVNDEQVS
jgi:hypothetical protein